MIRTRTDKPAPQAGVFTLLRIGCRAALRATDTRRHSAGHQPKPGFAGDLVVCRPVLLSDNLSLWMLSVLYSAFSAAKPAAKSSHAQLNRFLQWSLWGRVLKPWRHYEYHRKNKSCCAVAAPVFLGDLSGNPLRSEQGFPEAVETKEIRTACHCRDLCIQRGGRYQG